MELKIQCDCGQKYKFDVEPVGGLMPFNVNCPICGVDGTPRANQALAQMAPVGIVQTAFATTPVLAGGGASAPLGVASEVSGASVTTAPPPLPMAAPRLRVNTGGSTAVAAPPASFQPPPPPPLAPAGRVPGRIQASVVQKAAPAGGKKPSFMLGFLGAIIGVLVGGLVYFLVFKYTFLRLKLMAVGVGYLAGLGANLLGRKEGSKELGMLAAVLTLIGIVGAQYLVARSWWNVGASSIAHATSYDTHLADAKKVTMAVPNGSDEEIRIYLAKEASDDGEKVAAKDISEEDIKDFRDTTLPEARDLASGKTTKADFEKKMHASGIGADDGDASEGTFKAVFLLLLLSKFGIVSMIAAAGLAYKMSANA